MLETQIGKLGDFTLLRELGRGGMGVVYESIDPVLNRPIALKLITPRPFGLDPDWQERQDSLIKEAQSAALLAHPNIVTVFKAGKVEDTAFIEMELVLGQTLETRLEKTELDLNETISLLKQIATALDFAHARGVIHRDVKPGNIMLCEPGIAKLMDFGIAKLQSELLVYSGELTGSPLFMSPEQVRGDVVSPRSDQYSLAAVAYRLLTGGHTFSADTVAQLTYRVLFEHPVPVHVMNPRLNASVHESLKRALAKKAEERYPSCLAFVGALETALVEPPPPPMDTAERQAVIIQQVMVQPEAYSIFSRFPFFSGILFSLLVLAGLAILWWRSLHYIP